MAEPNVKVLSNGNTYAGLALAHAAAAATDILELDTGNHTDALTVSTKTLTLRKRAGQSPVLATQITLNADVGIAVEDLEIATTTAAVKTKYNGGAYVQKIRIAGCHATNASTLFNQSDLSTASNIEVVDNTGTVSGPIATGITSNPMGGVIARNDMTCLGPVATNAGAETDIAGMLIERNLLRINGSLTAAALLARLVSGVLTFQQNTCVNTDAGVSWHPYALSTSAGWTGSCLDRGNVYINAKAAGTWAGTGVNEFAAGSGYSTFSDAAANPGRTGDETVAAASMGFVDLGGGDYDLTAASPLVDTATGCDSTTDILGRPSPTRGGPDRGAYELPPDPLEVVLAGAILTALQVAFTEEIEPGTVGAPGDWVIGVMASPPTILSVAVGTPATIVDLVLDGNLTTGATITAPASIESTGGAVLDPAHNSAVVTIDNEGPPSMTAEDGEDQYLRVALNGEPLENPWSPLPDDPADDVEVLARAMIACLFTDRRAAADAILANPDNPYRGGTWSDPYCPARMTSRLWQILGAAPTEDTRLRAVQYATEDLTPFRTGGWVSSLSVEARYDGRALLISVYIDDSVLTLGVG